MSNDNATPSSSPQHRHWYDLFPRWLVITGFIGTTLVGGFFALLINWDRVEAHWPRMQSAVRHAVWKVEPVRAAPVSEPPPKIIEIVKPLLPCIDNALASEMMTMLRAVGGDKYERQFNSRFRGRDTCFALTLTEFGTLQMAFATKTLWNADPTFIVQPKFAADVKKYKVGTRLKIMGELARYVDVVLNEPDQIYIVRARVTEAADGDSMATGSIRR